MPVLQVYGVPQTDEIKRYLRDVVRGALVGAVCGIEELKLSASEISVFFHTEDYNLGPNRGEREVIVFIDGIFEKPERTAGVFHHLAQAVVDVLERYFVHECKQELAVDMVECFVRPMDPARGFAVYRQG